MMDPRDAEKLRKNRVLLVDEIEAKELLDYLFSKGILVQDDVEIIQSKVTRSERTRTLLDILPTRGPKAFDIFLDGLSQLEDKSKKLLADRIR